MDRAARPDAEFAVTRRVRTVTGGAGRDIGVGHAVSKIFPPAATVLRPAAERRGIEAREIGGERRDHRRAQNVRHIGHDVVGRRARQRPAADFSYIRLLSGKSRYREKSAIALPGRSMAVLAIFDLGLRTPSEKQPCRSSARPVPAKAPRRVQRSGSRKPASGRAVQPRRRARTPIWIRRVHDLDQTSLQIVEIGRDRLDLRFGQTVRDRLHDGRGSGFDGS